MPKPKEISKSGPWDYLKDIQTPLGLLPKIAAAIAGISEYLGFGPPMESKAFPAIFIAVGLLFVFGMCYTFWSGESIAKNRRMILASIVGFVVAAIVYATIAENYVVIFKDDPKHPYVVGFELHESVEKLRQDDPVRYTNERILNGVQRKPDAAWTKCSLRTVRFLYLAAWTVLWSSAFVFIGGCVAIYQRRKARR